MAAHTSRRDILRSAALSGLSLPLLQALASAATSDSRPNIIWIVTEDMSPDMGCYGDPLAHTPNLDKLAAEGCRFTNAYTHAPVCAPSRSGLITSCYPTTLGSMHMRSQLIKSPPVFTQFLRQAGYFVAWPGKTDFNFQPPKDAFDSTKEWINDPPRRPFFAYHNIAVTHESQTRANPQQHARNTKRLKPSDRQDPAKMVLPPFYPDTPEVREDMVRLYEDITAADYQIGDILKAIDDQGLRDNTIIIFFGDHGRGMPRYKRWPYYTGLHVPFIVRWPGKIAPGSIREDLVCFLDFGPTLLKIAGAEIPSHMQGQWFMDANAKPNPSPRKYIFGHRDRMDESPDRIRTVIDGQYQYIRNFRPDLPYAQRIQYNEQNPTMKAWRKANAEGRLNAVQKQFFAPTKPKEEFYELAGDPYQVRNLIDDPRYAAKINELRAALDKWIVDTKDMGAIPEEELIKRGHVKDILSTYESRKLRPGQTE